MDTGSRRDGEVGTIFASGPIRGTGTEVQIDGDDTSGTDVVTFRDGAFRIFHADDPGGTDTFSPLTCVARFSGTGTYNIVTGSGTGAYAGVSGSGTYSFRGNFFGERSGGTCTDDGTVLVTIRATGTTTLP